MDESGRNNSSIALEPDTSFPCPSFWREIGPWIDKYVNDVNAGERLYLRNAISTFSQRKEEKKIRATGCENYFKIIKMNSDRLGMKVNEIKTKLLCITAATSSEVTSFINTQEGQEITSTESMVLLGFAFDGRPNDSGGLC